MLRVDLRCFATIKKEIIPNYNNIYNFEPSETFVKNFTYLVIQENYTMAV